LTCGLPKVDGLAVLQQMRDNELTRTIRWLVLTSSKEEPGILKASYKLGAKALFPNRSAFDEFTSTVAGVGGYWLLVNKIPLPGGISS